MFSELDVFDEWGNYVGRFTPSGSGAFDGLILFVALLFLWTIGFLIYLIIRLFVKGAQAAKEGDTRKAALYLAIPILIILAFAFLGGNREDVRASNAPPSFLRVRGGIESECGWDTCRYGYYNLTNNSSSIANVFPDSAGGSGRQCGLSLKHLGNSFGVDPGNTVGVYCPEAVFDEDIGIWQKTGNCIEVSLDYSYKGPRFCSGN